MAEMGNWFHRRAIQDHRQSTIDSTFRPPPSKMNAKSHLDIVSIPLENCQRFLAPFTLFPAMAPALTPRFEKKVGQIASPLYLSSPSAYGFRGALKSCTCQHCYTSHETPTIGSELDLCCTARTSVCAQNPHLHLPRCRR